MPQLFDTQKFAAQVKTKRGNRPLRALAGEIKGVSISTLSRLEHGKTPDTETFLHLCAWLDTSPDDFMLALPRAQELGKNTFEQIALLLRMDTTLDAEVVEALIVLLQRLIDGREKEVKDASLLL